MSAKQHKRFRKAIRESVQGLIGDGAARDVVLDRARRLAAEDAVVLGVEVGQIGLVGDLAAVAVAVPRADGVIEMPASLRHGRGRAVMRAAATSDVPFVPGSPQQAAEWKEIVQNVHAHRNGVRHVGKVHADGTRRKRRKAGKL